MKKRKKMVRQGMPPELQKQHEETQALLAARIAYHRAKIEEERLERDRKAS
jgi:hypothetical protein